jgi:predicted TIM-barrel fold metal-dependent hydrolase
VVPLLDTHQHLIYPGALGYGWTDGLPALAGRAFTVEDYQGLTRDEGVGGTIFMEAGVDGDAFAAEAEMVAGLARKPGSGILGIIASARAETEAGFDAWVERGPELGIVGYRRMLHVVPDATSRNETFRGNVRKLGVAGVPFDMCLLARQLGIGRELAEACPGTQLVLDHCGNPDVAAGPEAVEPWREGLAALAAMPNVVVKLSGIYANVAPGTATLETVRPYVETVIETFGPERCLWGSDWPVVNTRGGDLPNWIAAFRAIIGGYSEAEQAAMAHGTAERVYKVRLPQGS